MPLVKKALLPPTMVNEPEWRAQTILLQTGTADERFSAARALAEAPEAVDVLASALAEPSDSRLREAIFTSLARQNSIAGYDAILRYLRSDDAELRNFALDAMRLMADQTAQRLPALLNDSDPDIRLLACELAHQMPPAAAAPLLGALLEREPQVNVCAAAIEVLAEIGGPAELAQLDGCTARFPAEFFLTFSAKTAAERIRTRIGP
jgi:HEAT repeat protein